MISEWARHPRFMAWWLGPRLSPRIQGEREPERRVYSVRGRDSRVGEMGRGRKEGESRKLY